MADFEKESGGTLVIPAEYAEDDSMAPVGNGRIIDLILPLIVLIGGCIFGMLYTGGILEGKGVEKLSPTANRHAALLSVPL